MANQTRVTVTVKAPTKATYDSAESELRFYASELIKVAGKDREIRLVRGRLAREAKAFFGKNTGTFEIENAKGETVEVKNFVTFAKAVGYTRKTLYLSAQAAELHDDHDVDTFALTDSEIREEAKAKGIVNEAKAQAVNARHEAEAEAKQAEAVSEAVETIAELPTADRLRQTATMLEDALELFLSTNPSEDAAKSATKATKALCHHFRNVK